MIQLVCKTFSPFPVVLTGTGSFGLQVLFIEIRSEQLLQLERMLVQATKLLAEGDGRHDDRPYHPHLTLGRSWCGFTNEDFAQMKILADQYLSAKPVSFVADSLRIYQKPGKNYGYQALMDLQL